MKKALHIASLLAFGMVASAAAQHPVHAQAPRAKPNAPAVKPETRGAASEEQTKSFTGISKKFNMTPTQFQAAYQTAVGQNSKLTRGQFIAAMVLGKNLSAKGVTTQAILDGLRNDKSIGQTLHSLGLSDKEADEAVRAADKEAKEAKEAERATDKAAKATEKKQDQQAKP